MLTDMLNQRACFKLVCGAGNEDAEAVEKLVTLFAVAGARYFDLSAREEVVLAAKAGVERATTLGVDEPCYLNVSVGIKGDPHVQKARIDQDRCTRCSACFESCTVQRAVTVENDRYVVNQKQCIGCGMCASVCPEKAVTLVSVAEPLAEVLPPLIDLGLDSIELHAVTEDEVGALAEWQVIETLFDGPLSLCLDRSCLGDRQFLARIHRHIDHRAPMTTIIQADGAPMSGTNDTEATTLQALATAQLVARAGLPVYLLLSGGTNSKTATLSRMFDIHAHGVAIGSFARTKTKTYVDSPDFFTNPSLFEEAQQVARALVETTTALMR